MSLKRTSTTLGGSSAKKQRKAIDIDTKITIINQYESGKKVQAIASSVGLAHSTVSTILKDKDRVKETAKHTTGYNALITRQRKGLVHEMEKLLSLWIDDQISKRIPVSLLLIQAKARSIFKTLKSREEGCQETFIASHGWFQRFRRRFNLHNRHISGEAASVDTEAAEEYINVLDKIIEEGGYLPEQIFNVDETGLYWKKMPERTYLHKEAAAMPGYKAYMDRLTLLFGGNVAGHKLVPFFIYRSENPRALKNVNKHSLPVYYRSRKRAWMTQALFEDWFLNCFVPEARQYCQEKNIPFKILLILDNCPGHPPHLDDLHSNIKVVYLPKNTTTILQPMDQGVMSAFKAYYLRNTFARAVEATENGAMGLRDFWKNYNILHCIKNIDASWQEVTEKCMKGMWKKCLKRFVDNFEGFDRDENLERINRLTLDYARKLQLEVEAQDVESVVNFVESELTDKELIELQEQEDREAVEETDDVIPMGKKFTVKDLAQAFAKMNEAFSLFEAMDPNTERYSKFERYMNEGLRCYREIYDEKKKQTKQSSILSFEQRTPSSPSPEATPLPTTSSHSPVTCSQSVAAFRSPAELKRHEMVHTGEKPHKCTYCEAAFNSQSNLKSHIRIHTNDRPYKCSYCNATFAQNSTLKQHIFTHTGEKLHKCPKCVATFTSRGSLHAHVMIHTGERPHKCPQCGAGFRTRTIMQKHFQTHSGDKPYKCDHCDEAFKTKITLDRHNTIHTGQTPHICSYCNAAFSSKRHLQKHSVIHNNGKPYHCSHCGASFKYKSAMRLHVMSHTGEKPHKCIFCEAGFTTKANLKVHMMTHTGEKPHKCSMCEATFITKSNLRQHVMSHTGDKPKKCVLCAASFKTSHNLQRHIMTHSREKPNKCSHCSAAFISPATLNKHLLMHSVDSPSNHGEEYRSSEDECHTDSALTLKEEVVTASEEEATDLNTSNDSKFLSSECGEELDAFQTMCSSSDSGNGEMEIKMEFHEEDFSIESKLQGDCKVKLEQSDDSYPEEPEGDCKVNLEQSDDIYPEEGCEVKLEHSDASYPDVTIEEFCLQDSKMHIKCG